MLTERRKADRKIMAEQVADLAVKHGASACIELEHDREITVYTTLQGVALAIDFDGASRQVEPDTYVLSWHQDFNHNRDWRFAEAFAPGHINTVHRHKATHVVIGFEPLLELLDRKWAEIKAGAAFEL